MGNLYQGIIPLPQSSVEVCAARSLPLFSIVVNISIGVSNSSHNLFMVHACFAACIGVTNPTYQAGCVQIGIDLYLPLLCRGSNP